MSHTETARQVADWIEPAAIASVILKELEDNDIEPTVANAQQVWLDALEDLHHLVQSSIGGLVNRCELATVARN